METQMVKNYTELQKNNSDMSRWYAVRTKSKKESVCVEHLTLIGIPVFCPMTKEFRLRRRQIEVVPLFPGYAFARFVFPDQYYDVKWARGVNRIVQFGECEPPCVDDSVIDFFRASMDSEGVIDQAPELKPGDPVRFRTGPFKNLMGMILSTETAENRIVVLMDLLYQARIEVDSYQVEKN